ncbi:MAG TPA: hypothetical protein DF712_03975 [Balneola sp.]|nr:hypothetical protein [Balneola sp.]
MKFSTVADNEYKKALEEPEKVSSGDRYFRPNQIENNQEVEFIFLEEDPLEYWQVFAENISDGTKRPFRFPLVGEAPSDEDILKELGGDYRRTKVQYDNDKLGLKANVSDSPASHCYVWPIWNLEQKTVQVFEVSQPSIFKQIKKETGLKKYRKGIGLDSDFSCTLHKVKEGFTKYTFNIIDRDEDLDTSGIEKAWEQLEDDGFNINVLIDNGDPFNSEG